MLNYAPQTGEKVLRPYGYFVILTKQTGLKIDQVGVNPNSATKPHKHQHRHEHWYAIAGSGEVTLDGQIFPLKKGQSVEVAPMVMHNIKNTGTEEMVVIKVQTGDYLEEDDAIV